jgi:hypothetical protein
MGIGASAVDQTLAAAKEQFRPVLLDFSAAPAWGACARLDAEPYEDQRTAEFIGQNFRPVEAHIKERLPHLRAARSSVEDGLREARPDRPDAVRPVQIRRRRPLEPSTCGQQELRGKNGWGGR